MCRFKNLYFVVMFIRLAEKTIPDKKKLAAIKAKRRKNPFV
jgi:hypothetical protein